MTKQRIRVAQCYTGGVGAEIVRRLQGHPMLHLVAVLVHADAKAGLDAGTLCNAEPNGIVTTQNLDDIIAAAPDAAIWSGLPFQVEAIARLLRAGVNVYTGIGAYWLTETDPEYATIAEACAAGGASLAAGGNIPGLISDVLPIFLSGYTGRIRQIRCWQRNHVATYPSAMQLRLGLGMGLPPGENEYAAMVDAGWVNGIRQSAGLVAAALGVECTDVRLTKKEEVVTPVELCLRPSGLTLPAGTVAGARWTLTASSGETDYLFVCNEQTAALGLGRGEDGWRQNHEEPAWRVEMAADPPIVATMGWPDGVDPSTSTAHLNACRAINTIPRLVAAPAGPVTVLDFPAVAATDGLASHRRKHRRRDQPEVT